VQLHSRSILPFPSINAHAARELFGAVNMAEESVHKQEFIVRNVSTQSVILYLAKEQVIRDINNVTLKV